MCLVTPWNQDNDTPPTPVLGGATSDATVWIAHTDRYRHDRFCDQITMPTPTGPSREELPLMSQELQTEDVEGTAEASHANDETVIELVVRYVLSRHDADPSAFFNHVTERWGELTQRGATGAFVVQSRQEVHMHTSCFATDDPNHYVAEALHHLGAALDDLPAGVGAACRGISVDVLSGTEHIERLANLPDE